MCAHASSGEDITRQIGEELYPLIDDHIQQVIQYLRQTAICNEATVLFDHFYTLKAVYESLRNYDTRLVFPSVIKVFNTKDNPGTHPKINIKELQELTQNKERAIAGLVAEIESEAELLRLGNTHPVFPLLIVFKTQFSRDKKIWNDMLDGWSKGCACFIAANDGHSLAEPNK